MIGYSPIEGYVYSMMSPGITKTILAYLYDQYSDDDALQAFVAAENQMSQYYLDWFNGIDLPIYPSPTIGGQLLDWVGAGIYGMPRPPIHCAVSAAGIGPFGTVLFGAPPEFGGLIITGPTTYYATTDDIYKRILTWHFFKGDSKYFSMRWLKRRVMRFLIGVDGTAPRIDFTPQISIEAAGGEATIRILQSLVFPIGGTVYGKFFFGSPIPFGGTESGSVVLGEPFAEAIVFKAAVDAGVLELPFQYDWNVEIQGS